MTVEELAFQVSSLRTGCLILVVLAWIAIVTLMVTLGILHHCHKLLAARFDLVKQRLEEDRKSSRDQLKALYDYVAMTSRAGKS